MSGDDETFGNYGNDTYEDFWGCTLTKGKNETVWNPVETEEDVDHKLQVTSACLGPKAKDGERNLVEVTTENDNGDEITCSIVSLRAGGKECMHLELGFNNPTKFKLREGNGPLSLCGTHLKASNIDMEDDSDLSEDEDIPNLVEPKKSKAPAPKPIIEKKTDEKPGKRPLEDKKEKQTPSKKKKVEPEPKPEKDDEDDDESDEEEEDEESEEEGSDEDEEMPSLLDGEAVEDDDEESEDEDEPEEGDDVDSDEEEEGSEGEEDEEGSEEDEEDEDEDDEEEESEEEKTPAKKTKKEQPSLTNGHAKKDKSKKTEEKTPMKTPSKSAGAKKSMDEIKALLLKSPNLPKKFDKFSNYMKNNMKVTDKKTMSDIWEFVQKNRK